VDVVAGEVNFEFDRTAQATRTPRLQEDEKKNELTTEAQRHREEKRGGRNEAQEAQEGKRVVFCRVGSARFWVRFPPGLVLTVY